jgi:hypothetical protein
MLHDERIGNWLALGVLLAAWNSAEGKVGTAHGAHVARPQALASQPVVTVRVLASHGMISHRGGESR